MIENSLLIYYQIWCKTLIVSLRKCCLIFPESEFQFQGKRNRSNVLIYILKAQKMLTKGCEAFLSFVAVDNNGEVSLSGIRMVKEFLDVFPKDLHG